MAGFSRSYLAGTVVGFAVQPGVHVLRSDASRPEFDRPDPAASLGEGSGASVCDGCVVWDAAQSLWLIVMTAGALAGVGANLSWPCIVVFAASTGAVLLLGHSVGMHRCLIHGSFLCPRWLERTLVYCGVLTGIAGPIGLLRTHDLRDLAQRQPSCHDYFAHRRAWWLDAIWQLHCRLELRRPPHIPVSTRIAHDPVYCHLERTWRWHQLPWALVLFACGGWTWVAWGVCARVVACNVGHWAVGHLAHRRGSRSYEVVGAAVQGYNVRFCALITMGESWHNNHHAFPGSARLGLERGQWDPGWWLIKLLAAAGWAWGLRTPADLPVRAEVSRLAALAP